MAGSVTLNIHVFLFGLSIVDIRTLMFLILWKYEYIFKLKYIPEKGIFLLVCSVLGEDVV